METGNLKAILHIATVAADKDLLIHLETNNGGGGMLYLYIHQVSQEKVQLNSRFIKTFPRFSLKPPALKPLRARPPPGFYPSAPHPQQFMLPAQQSFHPAIMSTPATLRCPKFSSPTSRCWPPVPPRRSAVLTLPQLSAPTFSTRSSTRSSGTWW